MNQDVNGIFANLQHYCQITQNKLWASRHYNLFLLLKTRHDFSLIARYSLKFTRCSLLVVKPLVTRCRIRLLLVAKFARYSLQKLLVTKNHLLLVSKKSLVTRYKFCSLLVAKNLSLLVAKNHSLFVSKFARYSLQKLLVAKFACSSLQKWSHFLQIYESDSSTDALL